MTSNNNEFNQNDNKAEGNLPLEKNQSLNSKFKDYGNKSLTPFVNLLHRYKKDFTPYIKAIRQGLDSACKSLDQSEVQTDKTVSGWFREGSSWFNGIEEKVQSGNEKDLLKFFEQETHARPVVMFASSYVAGLIFGRLGKHMMKHKSHSLETDNIH